VGLHVYGFDQRQHRSETSEEVTAHQAAECTW